MAILVTGSAGFIGHAVAKALLARGEEVIGVDNLNAYYEVSLKEARLAELTRSSQFSFHQFNIADREAMLALSERHSGVTAIVHLAAQAGVRYSLKDPYTYVESNMMGQVVMLELARRFNSLRHFVYASSSSVYGGNTKLPFSIEDPVEHPVSLYAATKRADELIAHTYSHLYGIPVTGLRFFTVYGPWGRPDMAAFSFTRAILKGEPIAVFNNGAMERDFTYIDDIVAGVIAATDRVPQGSPPTALYNLGNNKPEKLLDFIQTIETATGKTAQLQFTEMQPGDVRATYADIEASRRDLNFAPRVPISEGIPKFVHWYRQHYCV
ncbi:MAG: SDR family NAD(P)-dependent oxidoreductase [Alphaproteobacteria bacterium]|nr:SDR family NAD(P)-dependent oxidoreductase [Alphaproteobacteria bacterium]